MESFGGERLKSETDDSTANRQFALLAECTADLALRGCAPAFARRFGTPPALYGHIGGDEFAILIPLADGAADAACRFADDLAGPVPGVVREADSVTVR